MNLWARAGAVNRGSGALLCMVASGMGGVEQRGSELDDGRTCFQGPPTRQGAMMMLLPFLVFRVVRFDFLFVVCCVRGEVCVFVCVHRCFCVCVLFFFASFFVLYDMTQECGFFRAGVVSCQRVVAADRCGLRRGKKNLDVTEFHARSECLRSKKLTRGEL